jgi:hypothetical protein
MDDIVLSNDSAFDLTNVRAHVWIRQGDRTWIPVSCDTITAATGCEVENGVRIPGDHFDEMKIVDFDCDQFAKK